MHPTSPFTYDLGMHKLTFLYLHTYFLPLFRLDRCVFCARWLCVPRIVSSGCSKEELRASERLPPLEDLPFLAPSTAEALRLFLAWGVKRNQTENRSTQHRTGPSAVVSSKACPLARSMDSSMHEQMFCGRIGSSPLSP
ncbi:hypothetical protein DUNSADRAFT_15415 [Dunaliella salina]|uniref:Encoded protein n=1 Tax=Dunaliella salina TaxID=3046 RepID=A0ABQ7G5G3_DUNSA|nr:hypothetical protein DUNSADRAFT_15415 [Dunaliella salina]|eukprot:KAF5829852.1 hypothetical protein DUNSADRAFT_15415 [Dunaliella salina]